MLIRHSLSVGVPPDSCGIYRDAEQPHKLDLGFEELHMIGWRTKSKIKHERITFMN